jgi:hypothetical protein
MTALLERSEYRFLDDPEPTPVDSSLLESVGYDERAQTLEIAFDSGAVYHYLNVPEKVKDALLAAPSKGRFFNEHVRGAFAYRRIR